MEYAQMRDYSEFCEQLNDMRMRFHKWDSCERTVALYYLMVGLPFANAKFLQHALEQCISVANTPEAQCLERNANDPNFISSLLSERPQVALSSLLAHLPLLRPGNKEGADCYLNTIRKVLTEFIMPPFKIYNECVEIMSYVFVHPAFGKEDKKTFRQLLKQVLNRVTPENFIHSPVNESSDESVSPNPEPSSMLSATALDSTRLNRRSNSLTPAQTSSHESLTPAPDVWSSQENLLQQSSKPRSYSLSNDKTLPISAQTLQASSSETRLQDLQTLNNSPVMKSIVSWLKSLRLHKYSWVFNNLTYDQMLSLTEESLQSIGITKGARHKLLLSIAKLRERSSMLTELETEVMNGGDLLNALKKLKAILQSPLQVTAGEDLPSLFVKVLGKVCTQLLMRRQTSEECFLLFLSLSERVENSEVFTEEQKRRLAMWREQLVQANHLPSYSHRQHNNSFRNHSVPSQFVSSAAGPSLQHVYTQKSSSYPNVQNNQIGPHRHSVGSITLNNILHSGVAVQGVQFGCNEIPSSVTYAGTGSHHHVRFQDTEYDRNKKQMLKNVDIESSLESLCLQMMEHALGP